MAGITNTHHRSDNTDFCHRHFLRYRRRIGTKITYISTAPKKPSPAPCNPSTSHCGNPPQTTCNGVACHKEPFTPTNSPPPGWKCSSSLILGAASLPWDGVPAVVGHILGGIGIGMTLGGMLQQSTSTRYFWKPCVSWYLSNSPRWSSRRSRVVWGW